jgi:hypothetical protein
MYRGQLLALGLLSAVLSVPVGMFEFAMPWLPGLLFGCFVVGPCVRAFGLVRDAAIASAGLSCVGYFVAYLISLWSGFWLASVAGMFGLGIAFSLAAITQPQVTWPALVRGLGAAFVAGWLFIAFAVLFPGTGLWICVIGLWQVIVAGAIDSAFPWGGAFAPPRPRTKPNSQE